MKIQIATVVVILFSVNVFASTGAPMHTNPIYCFTANSAEEKLDCEQWPSTIKIVEFSPLKCKTVINQQYPDMTSMWHRSSCNAKIQAIENGVSVTYKYLYAVDVGYTMSVGGVLTSLLTMGHFIIPPSVRAAKKLAHEVAEADYQYFLSAHFN